MRTPAKRKLNFTVVFCEDEEENKIAFESAVKKILSKNERNVLINK